MAAFVHLPVLAGQTLAALSPRDGGVYLDGTVGGGGHAALILEASAPNGFLLGLDRDREALAAAGERLSVFSGRFALAQGNYAEMARLAAEQGVTACDGILLDIGVSSFQLDEARRGFSYMQDAPLDMRMDQESGISAGELVNTAAAQELTEILYRYGEEKWAARIAQFIVRERPLETTGQLVDVIKAAIPKGAREPDQHPAKRTFQALRIAVNNELAALEQGIDAAVTLLKPGGVLAIITFHSLEDRLVKEKFRYHSKDCVCPPGLPVCVCGHQAALKLLHKKPLSATEQELAENPRSRSARLRAAVKL